MMQYMVKDVLKVPALKSAALLSGKEGIYNEVTDIIVMEAHDIERWLKPGQLVLSSLFSLKESTRQEYADFVAEMKKRGASGLIIKMGRFVDAIPAGLIEGCADHDLPLIQINETVPYSSIILEVMQNLINQKADMLDVYQNVHHEFKTLAMREPESKDVLDVLKKIIGRDVSLYDDVRQCIATTERGALDVEVRDARELFREQYMHYEYFRELIVDGGVMQSRLVCKIPGMDGSPQYLAIREVETFVEMIDFMAIENAASTLQFEGIKQVALSREKESHMNDIVDHIINGKYKDIEELNENALLLKLSLDKKYRVVTWQHFEGKVSSGNRSFQEHTAYMGCTNGIIDSIKSVWPRNAYRIFSNRLTFIVEDNFTTDQAFRDYVEETLTKVFKEHNRGNIVLRVGISDQGNLSDIPRLAAQPLRVVQISDMIHQPSFVVLYKDLGIYRILIELSKENDLNDYVSDIVKTLYEHDPDYFETVRVFLDTNQNYKQTADILFVHPKTVRYRIEKIKELTKLDFDNPEEMLQIMIGIRIFQLLGHSKTTV
ncbi:hypothetical protein G7062_03435 [Erysipelothrix sp. HDW6C]|uniref:PucR family transcriptional regulator n=1 Tax=Erysipelothrix sp. HDW6C TaxID=2714930 RepID=UPI00140C4259|nr:PucR family transcriptional regulator [Erysipelothrix sp. HDW6C]QIK69398.1 hypothetical protein G7062_03435 [Erysipelothrix sp. HDW6C]